MGQCKAGARGQSGVGSKSDWGYCVLPEDERLKQLPITPPLVGCEAEHFLKPGANAWIVGYGTTGPSGQGSGVKRAVEVKVNEVSEGTVDVGDAEVGACHGDSGGPIYLQLSDGANDYGLRVFGSTSGPGAQFCDCSCSTLYVDIANHVKAIEENEKIDVTPCTDADGHWAPGPECNALQTQAMMGSGTFPSCSVARTSVAINSCGVLSAAGSGAVAAGSGAAGGSGMNGSAAAAGSGGVVAMVPAAGSGGAAAPVSVSGVAGSAGVTASAAPAGSSATGTSTQAVSAAGSPALGNVAGMPSVAAAAPSTEEESGCSAAGAAQRGTRTLWFAGLAVWLVMRRRGSHSKRAAVIDPACHPNPALGPSSPTRLGRAPARRSTCGHRSSASCACRRRLG